MKAVYINIMVGVMQMFTVPFMLVGWFWSFVWGIYMIILAGNLYYKSITRTQLSLVDPHLDNTDML